MPEEEAGPAANMIQDGNNMDFTGAADDNTTNTGGAQEG